MCLQRIVSTGSPHRNWESVQLEKKQKQPYTDSWTVKNLDPEKKIYKNGAKKSCESMRAKR